jgi:hypothetical protein
MGLQEAKKESKGAQPSVMGALDQAKANASEGTTVSATAKAAAKPKEKKIKEKKIKVKPEPKVREIKVVDANWIETLVTKGCAYLREKGIIAQDTTISFTVAKIRGRITSVNLKIHQPDGSYQSADPGRRVGLNTREHWDEWYAKLAITAKATLLKKSNAPRKPIGEQNPRCLAIIEAFPEYKVKTKAAGKDSFPQMIIIGEDIKIQFKLADVVHLTKCEGEINLIISLLTKLATLK